MGPVVLDSSVVIALLNRDDAHSANATRVVSEYIRESREFRISAITLTELGAGRARNAQRMAVLDGYVRTLGSRGVIPVDEEIARAAGLLRARRKSIRTPDSLVAATAEICSADVLLTADRALARHPLGRYIGAARR